MLRSSRNGFLSVGAGAALFAVCTLLPSRARADTAIAGDLDWTLPINSNADSGGGFGIRLGQHIHFPMLALTPELGFTYAGFGGDFGPKVYRGVAGLRIGVGEILRPGVYAHLGVGRMELDTPGPDFSHTAFTYDAGGFIDLTLLPVLNIGVHAAYNRLNGSDTGDAFEWATVGAHAALIF